MASLVMIQKIDHLNLHKECFRRVGYVPFTRNALKSKYIRHELEEKQDKSAGMGKVVEEYRAAIRKK